MLETIESVGLFLTKYLTPVGIIVLIIVFILSRIDQKRKNE